MKISTRLKYNISHFFVLVLLASFTNSCGRVEDDLPVPRADFEFSKPDNCQAPCTVTFTSNSENARGYNWDFGDNKSSTENNPKHTYLAGGTYTVTLTAAGDGGIDRISKQITIGGTATQMVIKRVILQDMPMNNPDGLGWDNDGTGPDVYFKILGPFPDTTTLLSARDLVYLNRTTADLPLEWEFDEPFTMLAPLNREFTFELWDMDFGGDTDDRMTFARFRPDTYLKPGTADPYPSTIEVDQNGVMFTLEVEWR